MSIKLSPESFIACCFHTEGAQTAFPRQDRHRSDGVPCNDTLWITPSNHTNCSKPMGVVSPILDVECGVVGRVKGGDVADKVLDVVQKLRFACAKSNCSYHSNRQPLRWAPHGYC